VLEQVRTSSPHRLIFANAVHSLLFLALALFAAFLRLAFRRKVVVKASRVGA